MHTITLIQDLAIIMLIAGFITILCHRLKQPVVLGYIIAGIIIGPYTPPFSYIHDEKIIRTLADLGVIFLMFSLGLEFNIHKLRQVGFAAFITAFGEIVLMIAVGYGLGMMLHWSPLNSLFLGSILAISSTTIIIKALEDLHLKNEKFAQLIFGVLIIEDIFAIAILALLSSISTTGSLEIKDILFALAKLSSFLVVSFIVGILTVPKILTYVAKFHNKEMLLIFALGLCFGFSLLVITLEYSVALGAFLIGTIIAESKQLQQIERLITPLRDMFSAIFFVSVGLLFNPKILVDYTIPILIITASVIIGKIFSCTLGMLLAGHDGRTSTRVGMGLAQIGEFSFIIASLGITLKVTNDYLYPIAVAVSAITTLLTPYLIKHSDAVALYMRKMTPKQVKTTYVAYKKWLRRLEKIPTEKSKAIHRALFGLIINLFIIMAIFLLSNYLSEILLNKIIKYKELMWTLTIVIALPFMIAVYRKIKTLLLLLSEPDEKSTKHFSLKARKFLTEVIPIVSIVFIVLGFSYFSKNILPPMKSIALISIIIFVLVSFIFPWLIKLYLKLQLHLHRSIRKNDQK